VLGLATALAVLLRFRARACVVLACLAAMLCTASIASADASVQTKTRVWDFSSAAPLNIRLNALASAETHPGNRIASLEPASGSPHAARGATRAFGGLSRAGEFGLKPYGQLRQAIQGTGLQAHHLIEQRFAGLFGGAARSEGLLLTISRKRVHSAHNRTAGRRSDNGCSLRWKADV